MLGINLTGLQTALSFGICRAGRSCLEGGLEVRPTGTRQAQCDCLDLCSGDRGANKGQRPWRVAAVGFQTIAQPLGVQPWEI